MSTVRETFAMIAQMQPELQPGTWVFRTFSDAADAAAHIPNALASFREDEGLSLILPANDTDDHVMRCITLHVQSALDGIGLTAAVAVALSEAKIPCNVIAAFHHDHIFVPANMADRALSILIARSQAERQG
ncbi:ACT domain-containing protein [Phaeobacter marinintestinus]|uniref:ACT domain-containing protein n=1 Tax=Falsiphaeobacter marinintestinus TaxID=1492905 RepID=UPI0011B395E6|nr:ACT domain-containing protein [Phaeobacter marinintestinus]